MVVLSVSARLGSVLVACNHRWPFDPRSKIQAAQLHTPVVLWHRNHSSPLRNKDGPNIDDHSAWGEHRKPQST